MVNTLNRVFGAVTIFLCFGLAQVELQVLDNGDITYSSTSAISGVEISHNDCATNAVNNTGGLLPNFSSSATKVILFDMDGGTLPVGSGNLISGNSCSAADLYGFVFANRI